MRVMTVQPCKGETLAMVSCSWFAAWPTDTVACLTDVLTTLADSQEKQTWMCQFSVRFGTESMSVEPWWNTNSKEIGQ